MGIENPSFSICIHGAPASVMARPDNAGSVTIEFEKNAAVTVFTYSPAMSADLAEAIAAVLEKHKRAAASSALMAAE